MSLRGELLRRVGPRRRFAAVVSPLALVTDRLVHRMAGNRRLATPRSLPILLLTTIGRRTGKRCTIPLVHVADDGPSVVGIDWGRSSTPEWVLNLAAEPRCSIETPECGLCRGWRLGVRRRSSEQ